MMSRLAISRARIAALVVSLAVLAIPISAWASPYQVTMLDLDGWGSPFDARLNNAGQVAGYFMPRQTWERGEYVFFYDSNPGGQAVVSGITLPTESQGGSYDFHPAIHSLNDRGQGVGFNQDTRETLVFDARTGAASPLPISWTSQSGNNFLITDSGAIYGTRHSLGVGDFRPFVYRDGQAQDLDMPPGMAWASLIAADDSGRLLVAAAPTPYGAPYGGANTFLFDNGRWNGVSGLSSVAEYSGRVMNASGDVVGNVDVPGSQLHAALVPNGGEAIDLGSLPGHGFSRAWAINDEGSIVGSSGDGKLSYAGFLYQNGVMTDLNDLVKLSDGWLITQAMSINNRGQILAAVSEGIGGGAHLALLTPDGLPTPPDFVLPEMPVPEPSTWLVFALAAVGLGCREAKRRGRINRER